MAEINYRQHCWADTFAGNTNVYKSYNSYAYYIPRVCGVVCVMYVIYLIMPNGKRLTENDFFPFLSVYMDDR